MSVSEPFIRRPVATSLLMVGLLIVGLMAYMRLPVAPLPQVEYPTIVVSTQLPGASAQNMAELVTTPLERQLGQIPSLTEMNSVSSEGSSQITLQFDLARSIDAAEQDVQAAINGATSFLPANLPAPPIYSKSNPADAPILTLAVRSDSLRLRDVHDVADSILAQRISQISGVGLVTLNGAQKPAVRVQADPQRLQSAHITLEDVRAALTAANISMPAGNIDAPRLNYTIDTNDQLPDAEAFRSVLVRAANADGSVAGNVRLMDVADVVDGIENENLAGWADGKRAILLNVLRQPGANILEVTQKVKDLLPRLSAVVPPDITMDVVADRTETIRASFEDVRFTLMLTVGLVIAVMYVFLRSWRATLIPGIAVPLSLILTFAVMYLLDYSLDNLSLMALTISTGFVVDDAIVMVENIARYVEKGEKPFEAALKGAKQIGFTIVSLTVSLVAVLIPLLFMQGTVGRLFREFAVTLATAICISAFLSLTLTAMMSAYLLRSEDHQKTNAFHRVTDAVLDWMLRVYERALHWVFAHQTITLVSVVATVALTFFLVWQIPKGFFPDQDTGLLTGTTQASSDVSFERMSELQVQVAEILQNDDAVAHVVSFIGADGTNRSTNTGRFSITLKTRHERDADAQTIANRLLARAQSVAGIRLWLSPVQDLQLDTRVSRAQYQYTAQAPNAEDLIEWSQRMVSAMQELPQLKNVTTDTEPPGNAMRVVVQRDTAARLGVSFQAIDETLYDAFGQRQVSTIFTQQNLYRVILEVNQENRQPGSALQHLYVRSSLGGEVPLSSVASFEEVLAPRTIAHQAQLPSITLEFDLAEGVAIGDAVSLLEGVSEEVGLPEGLQARFSGTAEEFRSSLESEPFLILAALVTVFIVLGVLYESLVHPITILSTLPSAGVGAILALILFRMDLGVIGIIGLILLIGIVKKNAIMMVDFAIEAERTRGLRAEEAIFEACLLRFRPITMTTLAALLGAIPLALGSGIGSELRKPLGVSVVGGLLVSQVLTLLTTPVIYLFMERLKDRFQKKPESALSPNVETSP